MPRRPADRGSRLLFAAAAVSALVLPGGTASSYTNSTSASNSLTSATLAAPTNPAAAHGSCVVLGHDAVNLTWTATTSTWATSQQVYRGTASGGPYSAVGGALSVSATSFTDTSVSFSTTYYYVIAALRNSWRTNSSEVSITTKSAICV